MNGLIKISLAICFPVAITLQAEAQNLVPNGSFEEYSSCPSLAIEFAGVDNWNRYRESADYYNVCANSDTLTHPCGLWGGCWSVPCNLYGCQESATGNGYAGVIGIQLFNPIYREIFGTQLIEPLTVGQTYYVSFKASPGYGRYFDAKWFSNKLGLKFSMNEYSQSNPPAIDNFAHVYTNDIISDTLNWTTISDIFVADSSYEYIMLGNFFDDENTEFLDNGVMPNYSYYYIDDVCVTINPTGCDFTSGMAKKVVNNVTVYPNPATNVLYISYPYASNPDISIFNVLGKSVVSNLNYSNNLCTVDLGNLSSGTYFLKIKEHSTTITKKFFIDN